MFLALALISSLVWGMGDFIGGIATRKTQAMVVVALSQAVGLVSVLLYGLVARPVWDWAVWPWALLASAGGALGLTAFYQALAIGRMGIVSPIASMGVVVPLFAGLLSGEQPSSWQLIGMFIGVVGVVFASGPELSGGTGVKPVLLAGVAAAGFGVAMYAIAKGADYSVFSTTVLMRASTVSVLLVVVPLTMGFSSAKGANWLLLGAAGFLDVTANVTFGIASTMGLLSVVSILGSLYPVVTALMAAWLLHERLLRVQYVGAFLTILGVCAIAAG